MKKPKLIEYDLTDHPMLGTRHLDGGQPETRRGIAVVAFRAWHKGKQICVRYDTRPDLKAVVEKYQNALAEWQEEMNRREAEAQQKAACPEWRERRRVTQMFRRAERLKDYPGDYFPALAEAEKALAAWGEKYPAAAREEDALHWEAKAGHEDEMASGALVYDADGWLSSDDQNRRSEEHKAKAAEYRQKAAELRRQDKRKEQRNGNTVEE